MINLLPGKRTVRPPKFGRITAEEAFAWGLFTGLMIPLWVKILIKL